MNSNAQGQTVVGATFHFLSWSARIVLEFYRVSPWATSTVVIASIIRRVASLLAFFLPLKVILLLGSEGVPSYFQGFVSVATRDDWIVLLAVGSVFCYLLSIYLENLGARCASIGSQGVLRNANQLALFNNQDTLGQNYFARFCNTYSNLIFAGVMLAIMFAFYPKLGYLFLVVLLVVWTLYSTIVGRLDAPLESDFRRYFRERYPDVLTIISSVSFLSVFGYLLFEFRYGDGLNILIAILAFLLSRNFFSSLSMTAIDGVKLYRESGRINSLLFSHHRHAQTDTPERRVFRSLFDPGSRVTRLSRMHGVERSDVCSRFLDVGGFGQLLFENLITGGGKSAKFYDLVYFPSRKHLAENEILLFENISAELLNRPRLIAAVEMDGFMSHSYEGDNLEIAPRNDWNNLKRDYLVKCWQHEPSSRLRGIYTSSRLLLQERLTADVLRVLEVAIDDQDEADAYRWILENLERVQSRLSTLPLFVLNPKLAPVTCLFSPDEGVLHPINWGHWTLAPIGAGLDFGAGDLDALRDYCEQLGGVKRRVEPADLETSALAWELEKTIEAMKPKSAFRLIAALRQIN